MGDDRCRLTKIHYPKSREELVDILARGKGRVAPVGGGVSFSFLIPPKVTELACMRALGLDYVTADGAGLRLGATATLSQLMNAGAAKRFRNGLFAEIASKVAATPNRNMITVGGNAVRVFIWSDLPGAYCAAGAAFSVRGAKGVRTLSSEEFYAAQPAAGLLNVSEFLEEIMIPHAGPRSGSAYEKFSETANTFALASATACVSLDEKGRCASARLVLGNLRPLPRLSRESREVLKGKKPTPELIGKAAAAAADAAEITRDVRASEDYKRRLAAVLARRALERAFSRASAGE